MTRATDERLPARVYDEDFVPALFGPWAETITDLAGIEPGHRVLDVACGTGVLARAAAARVAPGGSVIGLDPNVEMLDVARAKDSPVEWVEGRAESLPFGDGSVDRVVSQFGFMFFDDKPLALSEMMRVVSPGGRIVVAVCGAVDLSPGYAVLTELLHRLFGGEVAEAFRAPFTLGDRRALAAVAEAAGLSGARVTRMDGTVRFSSIAALVAAERACAWTLGGLLDGDQFNRLVEEAEESLAPFLASGAREIAFSMPCLVLTASRSGR